MTTDIDEPLDHWEEIVCAPGGWEADAVGKTITIVRRALGTNGNYVAIHLSDGSKLVFGFEEGGWDDPGRFVDNDPKFHDNDDDDTRLKLGLIDQAEFCRLKAERAARAEQKKQRRKLSMLQKAEEKVAKLRAELGKK